MTISLRDYQTQCIETIKTAYDKGSTIQLVTLPTGSGKTVIMAALAKSLGRRTLLLAHREELLGQAIDKFKLVWPKVDCGICKAEKNEIDRYVIIGSVQSCIKPQRLQLLKEQGFELLLIDEAHHAGSPSYQKIIDELGFNRKDQSKLLVGVTATPMRSDDKNLGDIFEEVTFSLSISTMIKAGYLSHVVGRRIVTKTSLNGVRSRDGDFAIGELSEAVNTPERNAFVAESYLKYANDRKGIAFCCDVQHCKDLAEALNKVGIRSEAVYGDMAGLERKSALDGLKSGEIQILTSCGVLTEGFDEPTISCIAMARPTRFKGLYIQCVGRGLRLHPSKSDCLVLDFSDVSHNLESIASLATTIRDASFIGEDTTSETELEKESRLNTVNISRQCNEEFDILGGMRFIWVPLGEDEWSLSDDSGNEIVVTPWDNGHIATAFLLDGTERRLVNAPLPIGYCTGCCEDYARRNFKMDFSSAEAPWLTRRLPPTENQVAFLEKNDEDGTGMSKAHAAIKIREIIAKKRKRQRKLAKEPITPKQEYFLRSVGIDTRGMSKIEAIKLISEIKSKELANA